MIEETRTALQTGETQLTFTKVDGSLRKMTATTNMELINSCLIANGKEVLTEAYDPKEFDSNDSYQAVFDLDLSEWRSFCWDRLEAVDSDTCGLMFMNPQKMA